MKRSDAFEPSLWRALGVFRTLALCYAIARFIPEYHHYAHPLGALFVLIGMTAWTAASLRIRAFTTLPVVVLDVAVGVLTVLSTDVVRTHADVVSGVMTLPTVWASAPVLACAIAAGWRGGCLGALAIGAADFGERGAFSGEAVHNLVLLVLAGTAVGYVTELAKQAEARLAQAHRVEAASRERQRLARDIHDGVLQVLALVQRRGAELGEPAAELSRLAREQELSLRGLVRSWGAAGGGVGTEWPDDEQVDLCGTLLRLPLDGATVSGPGSPVLLPGGVAREVGAAVAAAMDNVRTHAGRGARAWILVEDTQDTVLVSVRDDGAGIPPGRLEEAEQMGRLGVVHSIRGRLRDVGGDAVITSQPGQGTEVELRIPRQPQPRITRRMSRTGA